MWHNEESEVNWNTSILLISFGKANLNYAFVSVSCLNFYSFSYYDRGSISIYLIKKTKYLSYCFFTHVRYSFLVSDDRRFGFTDCFCEFFNSYFASFSKVCYMVSDFCVCHVWLLMDDECRYKINLRIFIVISPIDYCPWYKIKNYEDNSRLLTP